MFYIYFLSISKEVNLKQKSIKYNSICRKWGKDAHDFFYKLWRSEDAIEAGVSLISVTRITKDPVVKGFDPQWQKIPFECRHLDAKSLEHYKKKHNQSNYK